MNNGRNPQQQGTQTIRTYTNNPGVANALAMSQQQPRPEVQRVSTQGQGQRGSNSGPSGSGNTTIIRPAPGTTTDVIIRRPGPDGKPPPLPVMRNVQQQITSGPDSNGQNRKNRSRRRPTDDDDVMSGYGSLNSTTMLYPPPPAVMYPPQYPGYVQPQFATYAQPPYQANPPQGPQFYPQYYGIGTLPAQYPGAIYPAHFIASSPPEITTVPFAGIHTTGPHLVPGNRVTIVGLDPQQQQQFQQQLPQQQQQGDDRRVQGQGSFPNNKRLSDQDYIRQVLVDMQVALGEGMSLTALDPNNTLRVAPNSPGFQVLFNTENFFIDIAEGNFAETYFDFHSKYDILDTYGERLFFAIQNDASNVERSGCCSSEAFRLSVIGCDGNEYLTVVGDSGAVGIRTTIPDPKSNSRTSKFLGYVVPDQSCCSINTDFIIKDRGGHTCFKILHEDSNPNATEFEVYGNDMMKIGRMSKVWAGLPKPDQVLAHTYGISFPRDMDVREKVLMLGGLFAVYFRYFGDRNRDRKLARNAWITAAVILVFFIAFIVGLVFLAVHIVRSAG